jgi:hypothetical protein
VVDRFTPDILVSGCGGLVGSWCWWLTYWSLGSLIVERALLVLGAIEALLPVDSTFAARLMVVNGIGMAVAFVGSLLIHEGQRFHGEMQREARRFVALLLLVLL